MDNEYNIQALLANKSKHQYHLGKVLEINILPCLFIVSVGILLLNLSCGMADVITSAELVNQTLHYCVLFKY